MYFWLSVRKWMPVGSVVDYEVNCA